ncbi:MAG: SLBB domain-containing protein [Candidatus Omnitrophica bacterium]|nr:SLBB domain-containing protein [Candidatus Omnitrophota bacterium]
MKKIRHFLGFFILFAFCYILKGDIFSDYPELKLFGEDFFENFTISPRTYQLPLTNDYVLGYGDTLIINVWGFWEQEYHKEIEIDGSIFIPGIGKIYIGGKKLGDTKKIIENKFYEKYRNINVSVSCGKVRTINIFVLGEVKKPGFYEISPFFSILDVLAVAGGITKNGSLRKIEIIRSDGSKFIFDIYPFLLKGEKPKDFLFQSGDTIFVHKSENIVGIIGPVRKPGIYELKDLKIKEIIELSGGFLPNADLSYIQVERIDKDKGKILIDIKEITIDDFKLQNYDVVKVPSISSYFYYQILVTGAVKTQKVYGWREGIKISDVLKKEDLLPLAETEKGEIVRIENGTRRIIKFSPERIFKGETSEDLLLKPQDKIIVYSKERPEKKVVIYGEVLYPGEYVIESGEKIGDIIKRAGGFTHLAYPKGIVFLRESIKKEKQREIEKFVKEKREILSSALKSTLDSEEKTLIEKGLIALDKISEIGPSGRIVIKMEEMEKFEKSSYNIPLENGDIIYIPKKPAYISIIGEVNNPTNILYENGLNINDYISKAGGFAKDADRKNIFIVRVDGSSDKNIKELEPGDTIIVPFEPKEKTAKVIKDIVQIFYQIAVGIGVLIK